MAGFNPEEHEKFVSQRFIEEAKRRSRIEAFDRFVDLALDGVITLDQAITGFKEEYGDELKTASVEAV